ncbi:methyl-accepting chemotaxis protein [Enterobacter roggenkampii]
MLKKFIHSSEPVLKALQDHAAFIEFSTDGVIYDVNKKFLDVVGYERDELIGQHHRIFCDEDYVKSTDYESFWLKLSAGYSFSDKFMRYKKDGSIIWLEANYIPIKSRGGKVKSIIKIASDITERIVIALEKDALLKAASLSMGMITFYPSGHIITANDNFLNATGYSLADIQGKHHSLFCDKTFSTSAEYALFWERLSCGETLTGVYRRITKHGADLWLQASYCPVFDFNGKVMKVVKYAQDITKQKLKNEFEAQAAHKAYDVSSLTAEQTSHVSAAIAETSVALEDAITTTTVLNGYIQQLSQRSAEITEISNTIHDIAVQTKMLSLNATIEAARAGIHGRGFSVVAAEVRLLADRIDSATKQISGITEQNSELCKKSVVKIRESNDAIIKSVNTAEKTAEIISQISMNASAMMAVVEEINTAVQAES